MDLTYIIDRFEEDQAVCEASDKRMVNIPFEEIPPNSKEGDVLVYIDGEYVKDVAETAKRLISAEEKLSQATR